MADYTQFNLRGDTKSNWLNANPVLSDREIALETDTQRFKIGNGTSYYNQLPYGRNTGEYLNFYNVTALAPLTAGNYYTHETAILAVPSSERAKGTIVSYETSSGVWYTERFIGSDVSNWSVLANWEKVPDDGDIAQLRSDLSKGVNDLSLKVGIKFECIKNSDITTDYFDYTFLANKTYIIRVTQSDGYFYLQKKRGDTTDQMPITNTNIDSSNGYVAFTPSLDFGTIRCYSVDKEVKFYILVSDSIAYDCIQRDENVNARIDAIGTELQNIAPQVSDSILKLTLPNVFEKSDTTYTEYFAFEFVEGKKYIIKVNDTSTGYAYFTLQKASGNTTDQYPIPYSIGAATGVVEFTSPSNFASIRVYSVDNKINFSINNSDSVYSSIDKVVDDVDKDIELLSIKLISITKPFSEYKTQGSLIQGEESIITGAYFKFDSISIKHGDNIITKTWSDVHTDLDNDANCVFGRSESLIEDSISFFAGFMLSYNMDIQKFEVIYKTRNIKKSIILGSCLDNNLGGTIFDEYKKIETNIPQAITDYIKGKIASSALSIGDNFSALSTTDVHHYMLDEHGYKNYTNDALSSIDGYLSVDAIINLGDSIYYGTKKKEYGINALNKSFRKINKDKLIYCIGNHDFNGVSSINELQEKSWTIDDNEINTLVIRQMKDIFRPQGKRYFYRDFTNKKIRVISLDTQDINISFTDDIIDISPLTVFGIRKEQIEWLINTALNVPDDDWGIIITMHVGLYLTNEGFTANDILINRYAVKNVLSKYVAKTEYSYALESSGYFSGDGGSGTFSNYKGKLIAVLSGHAHSDGYTNQDGFNAIQSICSYFDYAQHPDRIADNETSFSIDLIIVDKDNNKIKLKRFGYGNDREYTYI